MFDPKANRRSLFLCLMFALLFAPSTFAQTVTGTTQGTQSRRMTGGTLAGQVA